MALDNFNKDPNRPAEYVDSAYEALKFNPQATQQVLQQGQNAGLAGLGAMAANRYQQRTQLEQKGQQAQQMAQQPPPPTVLDQQLQAMMQQGGIMGQLPNNIQMAQASPQAPQGGAGLGDLPVDPNTLPQEMAGGGLVALAQGGYLDGYADGGQVRGFESGDLLDVEEPGWTLSGLGQGVSDWLTEREQRQLAEERAYHEAEGRPQRSSKTEEEPGFLSQAGDALSRLYDAVKPPHKNAPEGEAAKVTPEFEKAKQEGNHLAILNEPVVQEPMLGEGATRLVQQEAMRSPERPPATPEMAERNIEQGRSMLPANEGGIPAARPQLTSGESYGVPSSMGAGNIEEQLAMIKALRGGAPSRPAGEADRYAQMLEDANTQKWLQTLTGAATGVLAGGGKNWGQAIGLGAQYGMNAYNRGAEEEGKLELGMLERAAQEQEAERKFSEASADKLLGIMQDTAKLGSTADTARMKAIQDARIEAEKARIRQSEGALKRASSKENAMIMAGGKEQSDYYRRMSDADAQIERELKLSADYSPQNVAAVQAKVYAQYGLAGNTSNSLGGGQGLGGGRPLGRITSAGGFQ